jgi:pimeloyl-ACP methyl ester carboxylesterase
MGPDFLGYLNNREEHRAVLMQFPFEQMHLRSQDGILLAGYYYVNPSRLHKTAVLIHGHSSNGFEGYASVGLKYIRHGYNILLMDNRACGNSEGKWCTFGLMERKGYAAVGKVSCKRKSGGCNSDPWDISWRCNCMHVIRNGSAETGQMRLYRLCVCQYPHTAGIQSLARPCMYHISWSFRRLCGGSTHETGLSVDEASPLEAVKHAKVPMLFIHGEEDRYVPSQEC